MLYRMLQKIVEMCGAVRPIVIVIRLIFIAVHFAPIAISLVSIIICPMLPGWMAEGWRAILG